LLADCAALWRSEYDSEVESGLGGRLETRAVLLGGSGKAPMLETLRRAGSDVRGVCECVGDFGGVGKVVVNVGTAEAESVLLDLGVGKADEVTDRGLDGVAKPEPDARGRSSGASGILGRRVLGSGSDGRGLEGGAIGGRDGR
jgi:hypothetical protein